jgi:hypothetical protein
MMGLRSPRYVLYRTHLYTEHILLGTPLIRSVTSDSQHNVNNVGTCVREFWAGMFVKGNAVPWQAHVSSLRIHVMSYEEEDTRWQAHMRRRIHAI